MTHKEKAKEITQKFINEVGDEDFGQLIKGIKCALICVDEILKEDKLLGTAIYRIPYWQSVKEEINKL